MLNGVYQNAAAMTGLESWNNVIAQNISQSSAPGYKKAMISFEGVESGMIGVEGAFGSTLHRASIQTRGVGMVDYSSGSIQNTDGTYDFAIEGDGFFELQAPDGQLVYTRDGQFTINADSELVSKQGYHIMSDTQNVIVLDPDRGTLEGGPDGVLRQDGQKIAKLGIRHSEEPESLIRSHGGFVTAPGSKGLRHVEEPFVRHGALEKSNVSATTEMINLINVSRSFQINQRVIQQHDDILGKAIRALGGTQ